MSETTHEKWDQYAFLYISPSSRRICISPVFKGVPALYEALGLGTSKKTLTDILSEVAACQTAEDFCSLIERLQEEDYSLIGYTRNVLPVRFVDSDQPSGLGLDPDVSTLLFWEPTVAAPAKETAKPTETQTPAKPRKVMKKTKPEEPIPNSILLKAPQLIPEWNYSRNGSVDPKRYSIAATKSVWWRCSKCGNEWLASASDRLKGRNNCPCMNKLQKKIETEKQPLGVVKGVNDLATKSPRLAAEWDDEANAPLKASDVKYTHVPSVGWKCPRCGTKWKAGVYYRYRLNAVPCPTCKARGLIATPEQTPESVAAPAKPAQEPAPAETPSSSGGRKKNGKWNVKPKWTLPERQPKVSDFVVGAKVSHRNYGDGIVQERYTSPTGDEMAKVFFAEKGKEETLFLKYSLGQMFVLSEAGDDDPHDAEEDR